MGRPLFSLQTPAVRVEPEPQPAYPQYEKWSYLKPFDPDADEFFEGENAVLEDFLNADQLLHHQLAQAADATPRERVLEYAENIEDGSASSSDVSSPTTTERESVSVEELEVEARGAERDSWRRVPVEDLRDPNFVMQWSAPDAASTPPVELAAPSPAREVLPAYQPGEMVSAYANMYNIVSSARNDRRTPPPAPRMAARQPTYIRYPADQDARPTTPPPAQAPPVYGFISPPPSHDLPNQYTQSPSAYGSPSPPPSVTPRIYSWSALNPGVHPPSPSPLANRSARRSVAHIAPTPQLVPVSRLLG